MKLLVATMISLVVAALSAAAEKKPNIILIISDDQCFTDYGFMKHEVVETPNLDRMAAESLLYTRGYTMPVCSPSLACLLTGRLPHAHGITGNDLSASAPQRPRDAADRSPLLNRLLKNPLMLPKALSDAGYLTFQTGKLWNATYRDLGFTHGMTAKQGRHGGEGLAIGRETMKPIYDFIEEAQRQRKPFFVWYAPMMPHDPHTPPEDLRKKYNERGVAAKPAVDYYAMVEWFDRTCGELDDYLKDNDLVRNTAVLYLADNGWDAARGYRGGRSKLSPYEKGIRTPMFIRQPGIVAAERDDETLASVVDFSATILKLAGIEAPERLPGIDLRDRKAMQGRKAVTVEAYTHDIANLDKPEASLIAGVVVSGWSKLILPGPVKPDRPFSTVPEDPELFDLKVDPMETKDLAKERTDEVGRFRQVWEREWGR